MDFLDVVNAQPSTVVVSSPLTVSGITLGSKTVSITSPSGELSINGGGWASTGTVQVGDNIRLRVTTPAGEAGETVTVAINLQSYGYIDWTVANVDNLMDEDGYWRADDVAWVVVAGTVDEAAAVTETLLPGQYTPAFDSATASDEATPRLIARLTVGETASVADEPMALTDVVVTDTGAASDSATVYFTVSVVEGGKTSDLATGVLRGVALLDETAVARDTAWLGSPAEVEDTAEAVDEAVAVQRVALLVTDATTGSDTLYLGTTAIELVDEAGSALDWSETVATLGLNMDGGRALVGDDALFYSPTRGAWVVTLDTLAVTRWADLPYEQVHQMPDGTLLGVAPDGVYTEGAATVDAEVTTGVYDFGLTETKSLRVGYVAALTDGSVELDAVCGGLDTGVVTYRPVVYDITAPTQFRVLFGRGRKSRWWGFAIRNTGEALELQDLRVVPLINSRRV